MKVSIPRVPKTNDPYGTAVCVLKKGLQDLVDNIEEILVVLPLESGKKVHDFGVTLATRDPSRHSATANKSSLCA